MTELKPLALSVKAILLDDEGRCLVLKRSMSSKGNPGKWDFPGGKADPGESFDESLLREIAEETGLTATLLNVAGAAQSETPLKRIVYLFMEASASGYDVSKSDEHDDFTWVHVSELPNIDLAEQFLQFAREYASKK